MRGKQLISVRKNKILVDKLHNSDHYPLFYHIYCASIATNRGDRAMYVAYVIKYMWKSGIWI